MNHQSYTAPRSSMLQKLTPHFFLALWTFSIASVFLTHWIAWAGSLSTLPPLRPWPRWLLLAKKWWKEGVFLQRFIRIKHSAYNGISGRPQNSGWLHLIRKFRTFGESLSLSLSCSLFPLIETVHLGSCNIKYKASWLPPVSFDRSLQSRIWLQKQFVQFTDWSQLSSALCENWP